LIGLVIAAQGALNLGDSLSPLPEPMPGASLVTEGAYSRCRHPLYQSLLLCSLGVTLALGSLHCPGFASTATPDFEALQPLAMPQSFTAV
jgi:protein-S-isoprenylcysteine O-methyltransferase Ste14